MSEAIELREYQQSSRLGLLEEFKAGNKKVILCLPTGAGKTVVFSYMAKTHLAKSVDNRVLILTNRLELLVQAGGTLQKFGVRHEALQSGVKAFYRRSRCMVAMVETYSNRLDKYPELSEFSLVIIDECHYGNFVKLFKKWDELNFKGFVVGCTATPIASKKDKPLSLYYNALVSQIQISELVGLGFLSPVKTLAPPIDRSSLRLDKGEYSEKSQFDLLAKRSVYAGLIKHYLDACLKYHNGEHMRTICFNVNIEHSKQVCVAFAEAGISSRHIDGNTPQKEREQIIVDYRSGLFSILCNVGILNAGFDDAETKCIAFNRATKSVSLWLQSLGRGSRIATGKDCFVVLDMAENWTELDTWDSYRDWASLWLGKKKKLEGVAPKKTCPVCQAVVHASVMTCPECGHEFPRKGKQKPEIEELMEVQANQQERSMFSSEEKIYLRRIDNVSIWHTLSVEDLEKLSRWRMRKFGWIIHTIRDSVKQLTKNEDPREQDAMQRELFNRRIAQLAKIKGYKPGWVARQQY